MEITAHRKGREKAVYGLAKAEKQPTSPASLKTWLGSWVMWGSIVFLFLALEIAVRSIEQAQWFTPQPSLTFVLVLAILTGWVLCQSRLPNWATHFLATVVGAAVTLWQASRLVSPPETVSRLNQLIVTLSSWWQAMSAARPSEGTVHFAVFLILFAWTMGYISTWSVLRKQNAWPAVCLGALTLLVNLNNLPNKYYAFLSFFLLAAVVLIGQVNLVKHSHWFKEHGVHYPRRGVIYFMVSLVCLGLLATSLASFTPRIGAERLATTLSKKMPWQKSVDEYLINFLAAVPAKQASLWSVEQTQVLFGDPGRPSDEVHFVLTSERPLYLRTRVYDQYTSQGWKNSRAPQYFAEEATRRTRDERFPKRSRITYRIVTGIRTDIVLTAGDFVAADIPGVTSMQLVPGDTIAIITPQYLRPGQDYTVTASISSATPADLSQAGENYPQRIRDYYLQLPPTLPERVRQLSQTVTKGAKSPYDKALAVKRYLSQMRYNLRAKPPPQSVDGVDYFLFDQPLGNCVHFASAMVVMLRSVGVPARLYAGYAPGEWDASKGTSTIRAKHFHTWPAVYFPGYGWIELEAVPVTASRLGTDEGDEEIDLFYVEDWEEWSLYEELWTGEGVENGKTASNGITSTPPGRLVLSLTLLIIGIILLFLTLRLATPLWLKHLTGPNYAVEVYAKMCLLASLVKLGPKPQQTPLEYGAGLAAAFPMQANALSSIIQTYLESRFSQRKELGHLQKRTLQESWREVYPVLMKRLFHV